MEFFKRGAITASDSWLCNQLHAVVCQNREAYNVECARTQAGRN